MINLSNKAASIRANGYASTTAIMEERYGDFGQWDEGVEPDFVEALLESLEPTPDAERIELEAIWNEIDREVMRDERKAQRALKKERKADYARREAAKDTPRVPTQVTVFEQPKASKPKAGKPKSGAKKRSRGYNPTKGFQRSGYARLRSLQDQGGKVVDTKPGRDKGTAVSRVKLESGKTTIVVWTHDEKKAFWAAKEASKANRGTQQPSSSKPTRSRGRRRR